jgi:adenylate cyclase
MERRLAAILAADVVGYSRLIRADEEGTITALQTLRSELIEPKIAGHNGRIVKLMGDGILVEFASVVDAVRGATEVQQAMAERNAAEPDEQPIEFRIGINLGDVVIEGDDIHGDGVNIAARLEGLADPGGICISGSVHEQIRDRLDFAFEAIGEQSVKNVDRPVEVWKWSANGRRTEPGITTENDVALNCSDSTHDVDVLHRPAVLFLPFDALSRTDEDIFLASGLCEDIRTTLACWRSFPVVGPEALGSATGDIQHLAGSVDADYAVTGSVRRVGDRARVVARLIDASSGQELWSQTFDGDLADVFEFQDDLSRRIVSQIEPEISQATARRIPVVRPKDLATWELLAKAVEAERRGGDGYGTPEANNAQREFVSEAIERDPELCEAWARLARCHFRDFLLGWAEDGKKALEKSLEASARAVEIDPANSLAQAFRSQCLLFGKHDPQGGFEHAREAVRLNPSNVMGHYMMGCSLVYCGEPDTAYTHYESVLRLNPAFSAKGALYCDQMMCRALAGYLEEAVQFARKMMDVAPHYLRGLQRCVSVLAHAGKLEEARDVLQRIDDLGSSFSEAYVRETYPFRRPEDLDFLIEGLRAAGWNG